MYVTNCLRFIEVSSHATSKRITLWSAIIHREWFKDPVYRLDKSGKYSPLDTATKQLNAYELPISLLLQHLDEATSRPRALSGPIDKVLANCHTLPVVCFDKIEVVLPIVILKDFSTYMYQQSLWEMCKAVSNGEWSPDLFKRYLEL